MSLCIRHPVGESSDANHQSYLPVLLSLGGGGGGGGRV